MNSYITRPRPTNCSHIHRGSFALFRRLRLPVKLVLLAGLVFAAGCTSKDKDLKRTDAPVVYRNDIGMEFVRIPAGSFVMGSNQNPVKDTPEHNVTMSSFLMMNAEVTNAQYAAYREHKRGEYSLGDDQPVTNLTRTQTLEFIAWLGKRDGVEYKLPTEAQWEYAARGGLEGKDYPWGDNIDSSLCLVGGLKTMPVKSYPPNGYGLYDMCGNVGEMVREIYYEYSDLKTIVDPVGPTTSIEPSDEEVYIVRGIGVGGAMPWIWLRARGVTSIAVPNDGFRLVIEK